MTPHKVAVSIINYRTAEMTLQCVQSVLKDLDGLDARIIIVDNFSDDGSVEKIQAWLAEQPGDIPVDLVCSATNSGFSGGHNQGIAACAADYYLVLNSDALVRPGFFSTILAAADKAPDTGLFAPRIEYEDGGVQHNCFRFHSPASEFIRGAQTGFVTRFLGRYDVPLGQNPAPDQIEWASFACILLRAKMIDDIGPMDEGYFLYYEDTEYCLRAQRSGWKIAHVPAAIAIHFRGGSGPVKALQNANARLPLYFYSSRTRFLYQAYGWFGYLAANLLWYAGRGFKYFSLLFGRKIPPVSVAEGRLIWVNMTNPAGCDHRPEEAS